MRNEDWQRAFGSTPKVFEQRVLDTLNGLKEDKKVKNKLSLSVIAALLALLMLMGTAWAVVKGFGIADFMSMFGMELPKTLIDAVEQTDVSVSSERVRYTVQEVLLDDSFLRMTIACEPADTKTVILAGTDEDTACDLRTSSGDTLTGTTVSEETEYLTLKDLAAEKSLQIVRIVPCDVNVAWNSGSVEYVQRDGILYYYLEYELIEEPECSKDGKIHLELLMKEFEGADAVKSINLDIPVSGMQTEWITVTGLQPAEGSAPLGHYTFDSVNVQISDHEIRYDVHYHVNPDVYILSSVYAEVPFTEYSEWLLDGITREQLVFEDFMGFDLMLDEYKESPNFEYGYTILPEEADNHPLQLLTPGMELVCSRSYLLSGDAPTVLHLQGAGSADEAGIRLTIELKNVE